MKEIGGFSTFWELWRPYQRKSDGRGKARPAYKQMIEMGYDQQDIIDGARWYLRNLVTDEDKRFIPLAASWLRAERFADDCEKEREYQAKLSQRSNVSPIRAQGTF